MAYSEKLVDHYENPRNVGSFDKGDANNWAFFPVFSIMVWALNKLTGQITMNGAALGAATEVAFTLTNSTIAATDVVLVTWKTNVTHRVSIYVSAIVGGSCKINMVNHDIATNLIVSNYVLNFVVIKAATS